MKTILTVGGFGLIIGYALYEWLLAPHAATAPAAATGAVAAAPAPSLSQADLLAYVISQGGNPNALDADQWNYYYSNATGIPQTTDLFGSAPRTTVIDEATYYARRAAAGLTGFTVRNAKPRGMTVR